ncbi:hypothetical protein BD324DRAFT_352976 [Kockovaella imperatae]|uniref:Uncharacterized protein n=1 Tax=Kockovaella imperatae TaxID=4999 RepID=A0A1Y1ULM8_9TREE|nr:hypothetical protein BD324DRAFT_352976 [Kockovaella imperatae]ORX38386.1 hypothetical protein BD324DRAFT_352976 [Kockovaella imperatae]
MMSDSSGLSSPPDSPRDETRQNSPDSQVKISAHASSSSSSHAGPSSAPLSSGKSKKEQGEPGEQPGASAAFGTDVGGRTAQTEGFTGKKTVKKRKTSNAFPAGSGEPGDAGPVPARRTSPRKKTVNLPEIPSQPVEAESPAPASGTMAPKLAIKFKLGSKDGSDRPLADAAMDGSERPTLQRGPEQGEKQTPGTKGKEVKTDFKEAQAGPSRLPDDQDDLGGGPLGSVDKKKKKKKEKRDSISDGPSVLPEPVAAPKTQASPPKRSTPGLTGKRKKRIVESDEEDQQPAEAKASTDAMDVDIDMPMEKAPTPGVVDEIETRSDQATFEPKPSDLTPDVAAKYSRKPDKKAAGKKGKGKGGKAEVDGGAGHPLHGPIDATAPAVEVAESNDALSESGEAGLSQATTVPQKNTGRPEGSHAKSAKLKAKSKTGTPQPETLPSKSIKDLVSRTKKDKGDDTPGQAKDSSTGTPRQEAEGTHSKSDSTKRAAAAQSTKKAIPQSSSMSFLQQTLASLQGSNTPKREPGEKINKASTPADTPKAKNYRWGIDWKPNADQQAQLDASKAQRDAERERRRLWKANAINLQEPRDAYRLHAMEEINLGTAYPLGIVPTPETMPSSIIRRMVAERKAAAANAVVIETVDRMIQG